MGHPTTRRSRARGTCSPPVPAIDQTTLEEQEEEALLLVDRLGGEPTIKMLKKHGVAVSTLMRLNLHEKVSFEGFMELGTWPESTRVKRRTPLSV